MPLNPHLLVKRHNLLRFGNVRRIPTLILRKELSVAEKILGGYWQSHQKKNVSRPMIGAMEKSGKNNLDAHTDRIGEIFVICPLLEQR